MGKGDQRSRRGKIWRGTFGKRRPKKNAPAVKAGDETKSEVSPEPAVSHARRVRKAEKETAPAAE